MTAIGKVGQVVNVGDEVTVLGIVTAISGAGSKALVTVSTQAGDTVTAQANDCYAPQTDGPAISHAGKGFSIGDPVSVMGIVTAIAGSGQTAKLTTVLKASAAPVVHKALTVYSPRRD